MAEQRWDELDHQSDLGPLARAVGRRVPLPRLAAVVALAVLVACAVAVAAGAPHWLLLAGALVAVVGLGAALRPTLDGPLAWLAPSTLFAVEAGVVAAAQLATGDWRGGAAFAFVAAVAYRRYDVIYRLRDLGAAPPAWTRVVTLGAEGRVLLVAAVLTLAPHRLGDVLLWAGATLAAVVLLESSRAWLAWVRAAR